MKLNIVEFPKTNHKMFYGKLHCVAGRLERFQLVPVHTVRVLEVSSGTPGESRADTS